MDELEQTQEEIKEEMSQMKEQIAKILEALQSMKNIGGTISVTGGERSEISYYPPVLTPQGIMMPLTIPPNNPAQPTVTGASSMPPYGLPPGYVPPIATNQLDGTTPISNPQSGINETSPTFPPYGVQPHPSTEGSAPMVTPLVQSQIPHSNENPQLSLH